MSDHASTAAVLGGLALVALAGVLALAPEVVHPLFDPASLDEDLSKGPAARIAGTAVLLAAVVAGWVARRRDGDLSDPGWTAEAAGAGGRQRVEGRQSGGVESPGLDAAASGTGADAQANAAAEARAAAAGAGVPDGWASGRGDDAEVDRLAARLRPVAADAVALTEGCDAETARQRVEDGEWTDDRIVASVLGGPAAPDAPLSWRLRRWFFPERTSERAIERTIDEIEARQGGERP